jgi:hydroxymethylpyrimidine/phosphomethylpyrimidine kinase
MPQPTAALDRPRTALTIAGSDSGGGAGIQADLKTFQARGVYGTSAIVAITAQNTRGVHAVELLGPDIVRAQILAVFDDIPVDAVKLGMLGDAARVHAVADALEIAFSRVGPRPLVLDPVMVAKGGASLLQPDAVAAIRARLLPLATVVTPNLPEADVLGALPGAVLLKGGHADGAEVVDRLLIDGAEVARWTHPRIHTPNTHGTGCTLSSAVAAELARGAPLVDACGTATGWVATLVARAAYRSVGGGHGPLLHGEG